jgi:ABC-type uncharacterized transport system substrate-binding protein
VKSIAQIPGLVLPLLSLALHWAAPAAAAVDGIIVVTSSEVPAYQEALAGFKETVKAGRQVAVVDLAGSADAAAVAGQLNRANPSLVVVQGATALKALTGAALAVPVLSAMVLGPPSGAERSAARVVGTVSLEVPLGALLAELKRIFPGQSRLGILRGPSGGTASEAPLAAQAAEHGFTLRVVDCPSPKELLDVFLSLKQHCDFVWCLPDIGLYSSATVKPLIMASLQNKLAIIGFSESFVRAGAAAGIYPDFRELGRQTGAAAEKYLAGQNLAARQQPAKFKVALNERVLRMIGLRPRVDPQQADVLVVR